MAQITQGVRAVLSHPVVYSSFQSLMGAHQTRARFVERFVKPTPGMKILDVGCGPADILDHLPDTQYWGFDISDAYINKARKRFGDAGTFECKLLEEADLEGLPEFDTVLAIGLLHHLDDVQVTDVMKLATQALKPGGKLITLDPCYEPGQNFVAKFLIDNDRGQNVRNREGYSKLAGEVFDSPKLTVQHQTWIPYTHCIIECVK